MLRICTNISSNVLRQSIRYSLYNQKNSYKADHIFKDYYSRRLTLSHVELFQFFNDLTQQTFTEQDHRWISLAQNLEKNVEKFKVEHQIFMFKTLVDLKSKTQLYQKLRQALLRRANELTFDETAILLWGVSKNYKKEELADLSLLFKRLNDILSPQKEGQQQPTIVVRKKQKAEGEQNQQKTIKVSASSLSMILSSMARLGISDKQLLKRLVHDGVKANIADFSCTSLCTFLISFEKLGLRNKRDTFQVYKAIRTNYKQLETAAIETLLNLAVTVANLSQRDLSEQQKRRLQLHKDESAKQRAQLDDMRIFYGWICQTVLLREPELELSKAALMLHYSRKIQYYHRNIWQSACRRITENIYDAKVVDLVMALKAIVSLNRDNRAFLQKEEQAISHRLWQLQSSISGKSLYTLAMLFKMKKIRPPQKIGKMLTQHLIELQTAKDKKDKKQPDEDKSLAETQKGAQPFGSIFSGQSKGGKN